MNKNLVAVTVGALCAVAALYYRDEIMTKATSVLALWKPPGQYAGTIAATETRYGIPRDLLARLLYQESRYRVDIITGELRSPVGATGIAQFMPATAAELGIDPLNPTQSIDAAGKYLRSLYSSLGSWTKALAAYNWGIGNVQRKGLAVAPRETVNYYTQILADVNDYHGTAIA
ncbi:lytic transglycosylase domain-containing protein [Leptospira sp. 96542]|nr:lytic transglycosylase domain-containing protein [Leptospira sp. 96542]